MFVWSWCVSECVCVRVPIQYVRWTVGLEFEVAKKAIVYKFYSLDILDIREF